MTRISIACQNVYPIFDHTINAQFGGMETRAAMLARGLTRSGRWCVCFTISDFGQPRRTTHENISFEIYRATYQHACAELKARFSKRKWLPVVHLDRRDLALAWQIPIILLFRLFPSLLFPIFWRRLRSDIVCCFGNNPFSAQVIADCLRVGIRTVLCIASDDDLSPNYRPDDHSINDYCTPKWMAHYALENADQVFVQTESQLRALESHFGRRGKLIRNPVDISAGDPAKWPARSERDLVLWIGRSDTFHKQPLLMLELVKLCPDLPFLMILNKTHADVYDAVVAQCPPNLTIVERVPHREIWNYYRRARVFVSTSAYEGFPNTFLQSAAAGAPVASLSVDPEGILARHGCGLLADGDLATLERHVRTLWADHEAAQRQTLAFHQYALAQHGLDSQVSHFEALLQETMAEPLLTPRLPWWRFPFRRFVRRGEI
jgi:glycosyltransferase involved in cell wall biosynthesis